MAVHRVWRVGAWVLAFVVGVAATIGVLSVGDGGGWLVVGGALLAGSVATALLAMLVQVAVPAVTARAIDEALVDRTAPLSRFVGILVALGLTRQFPLPLVLGALVLSVLALFVLPGRQTPAGSVLVFVTAGILAGSMLHLVLYAKTLGAVLSWPPLAGLGRISFGLYVFHLWAYVEGVRLLRLTPIPDSYTTRWLAGLTLCIVVATASYHLFERPITRMKPRAAVLQPAPG